MRRLCAENILPPAIHEISAIQVFAIILNFDHSEEEAFCASIMYGIKGASTTLPISLSLPSLASVLSADLMAQISDLSRKPLEGRKNT